MDNSDLKFNQIYNEDCLLTMEKIKKWTIDLIIADPPYNFTTASAIGKINPVADMWNSATWFSKWIDKGLNKLKPDGAIWSFCNWRTLPTLMKAVFDIGYQIESLLVWDKMWIGPGGSKGLRPRYELVALICNPEFKINNRGIPDIKAVKWSANKPTGHRAEKPLELIKWLIEISDKNIIYDPFMGSGTTGVACEILGCQWIGSEIDPRYIKLANNRILAEKSKLTLDL